MYRLAAAGYVWQVALTLGMLASVGFGAERAGLTILRRNPVLAVWLMAGYILFRMTTVAAALAAIVVAGAFLSGVVSSGLSDSMKDTVGTLLAAGLTIVLTILQEPPDVAAGHRARKAFDATFGHRVSNGTRAFDAVYEEEVARTNPPLQGWGILARHRRARIIAANLRPK